MSENKIVINKGEIFHRTAPKLMFQVIRRNGSKEKRLNYDKLVALQTYTEHQYPTFAPCLTCLCCLDSLPYDESILLSDFTVRDLLGDVSNGNSTINTSYAHSLQQDSAFKRYADIADFLYPDNISSGIVQTIDPALAIKVINGYRQTAAGSFSTQVHAGNGWEDQDFIVEADRLVQTQQRARYIAKQVGYTK